MTRAYRRFVVPCVSTVLMLIVLVGLGTWQVYRLHWKERILARIAAAEAQPAVPLTADPALYTKISVTGRFRFDLAVQFGAEVRDTRSGTTMGAYQIVPLERGGGHPILIDRGWIPQSRKVSLDDPAGVVTVAGYIRAGDHPHWFSPNDDDAARLFYTLDPQAIAAAIGLPNPEPFVVVAMGPAVAGSYPSPAQHLPRPPNNHLSYVITWYGLAVSLLVIFGVWMRKALRS